MGHYLVRNEKGQCIMHISFADVYEFEGFRFEYGFMKLQKLNKDGEVSKRMGRKFLSAVGRWEKLSKKEREKYRVKS